MDSNKQTKILGRLSNIVSELQKIIEPLHSANELRPTYRNATKFTIDRYKETKYGIKDFGGSVFEVKNEHWHNAAQHILSLYKATPSYTRNLKFLNQHRAHNSFDNFFIFIIEKILKEGMVTKNVLAFAAMELLNEPLPASASAYLMGIGMKKNNSLRLSKTTHLRKIVKSDLEYETAFPGHDPFHHFKYPTAVLEINKKIKPQSNLQREVNDTIKILTLIIPASIYPVEIKLSSNTILAFSNKGTIGSTIHNSDTLKVSIDPIPQELIQKAYRKLSTHPLPEVNGERAIDIAYKRYTDSLISTNSTHEKIHYAISGLEALLSEDSSELKHRLSLRLAKMLDYLGLDSTRGFELVNFAYTKIRNKIAHGDQVSKKDIAKLQRIYGLSEIELLFELCNYLRLIIIFTVLNSKLEKKSFLNSLDESMFNARKKIPARLFKKCNSFKINFHLIK